MSLLLEVLGWVAAALGLGLWLGERGRRMAAERWATTGRPGRPEGAIRIERPASTEDVIRQTGTESAHTVRPTAAMLDRAAEWMRKRGEQLGRPVAPTDARRAAAEVLARAEGRTGAP